jgi:hypothetical protein
MTAGASTAHGLARLRRARVANPPIRVASSSPTCRVTVANPSLRPEISVFP